MNTLHQRSLCVIASSFLTLPSLAGAGQEPTPAKPAEAPAQDAKPAAGSAEEAKPASNFSKEQLEQIAAPMALYPDSLLTQMMMAATYPLEIVEAARWQQKNATLKGKPLEDALKANDWDPSVKSLCTFPDVLKKMNENLDWTQDLGDAFLGQRKELMDTIQVMRGKALEAGQLKSTEQQKVTQGEDKVIVIQSTNPEVIYVPTYSPAVVYGPAWGYPTYYYPPMYVGPPPGTGFITFGMGVAFGAAVWGNCNWGHGDVDIDVNNYNNFNKNTNVDARKNQISDKAGGKGKFNHDPSHRKGVNYKNPQTAQQFGAKDGANRVSKDQARGYDRGSSPGSNRAGTASQQNRAGTTPSTSRGNSGASRPGASTSQGSGSRSSSRPSTSPSTRSSGSSGGALSGSRSPSLDRAGSSRGAASRGGGGRSGGGGRGGGGGGRRR